MKLIYSLLIALSCGYYCSSSTASELIDDDGSLSVERLAQQVVCDRKYSGKLVGRISSIIKLADYFEASSLEGANSNLDEQCLKSNLEPLRDMKKLVSIGNENVCGLEKVALIEKVHKKYLSTVYNDMQVRYETGLSKSLKAFITLYIMEISSICKKNLINNLEWDIEDKLIKDIDFNFSTDSSNLDLILFGLAERFPALKEIHSYEDIIMFWDIVGDSFLRREKSPASSEVVSTWMNPITTELIMMFVKTKNTKKIIELQEKCYLKFKPIYEKLILPIIKLADLGYSYNGDQFDRELNELKSNELVNKWYTLTQICETIMPIRFYQDASMTDDKELVLIDKDEAERLELEQPEVENKSNQRVIYEPSTNSLIGYDKLYLIETSDNLSKLLGSVKSNLSARDRQLRRVLARFSNSTAKFIKNRFGKLFITKRNNGITEKEDVAEIAKEINLESVDEQNVLKVNAGARHQFGVERQKNRVRNADVVAEQASILAELRGKRTQRIEKIFQGILQKLSSATPSSLAIITVGLIACAFLVMAIVLISTSIVVIG